MSKTEKHRLELHRKVSPDLFEEFLHEKDTDRNDIERKVVNIIYKDVLYTVESYANFAFLRVSTHTEDEKIDIPEFFGANTEITEDAKYFSYNLSNPNF